MEYLTVGKIIKTVGLKGELKIYLTTSFSFERFQKGKHLFLKNNDQYIKLTVMYNRQKDNCHITQFKEIIDVNEAQKYVGQELYALKDYSLLKENEYYYSDLINCQVYFNNSIFIGTVAKIEEYAAYKTLRIKREKAKDVLIPFVEHFIENVDIINKKITIKYIAGLL